MQTVSSQIASRSELLELVETLGMYARIEQPDFKQRQPVKLSERVDSLTRLIPLQ